MFYAITRKLLKFNHLQVFTFISILYIYWVAYCFNFCPSPADSPASLVSSDRSVSEPVEASIEDLHDAQYEPSGGSVEADARGVSSPSALEEKLDREFQYHKHGSYNSDNQPDAVASYSHNNLNPFLQNHFPVEQQEQDRPVNVSSVHSWTKAELLQPTSMEEPRYRPASGLYESMNTSTTSPGHLPMSASTSSLTQLNQQHPHSHCDRQQSWPFYPVPDTSAPEMRGHEQMCFLPPSKSSLLPDQGTKKYMSLNEEFFSVYSRY